MSQTRFTPITSSLLARKGDAVPSAVPQDGEGTQPQFRARADSQDPTPQIPQPRRAIAPPGPPEPGKPHKMVVTLTALEFEKLGIVAVKKGVTRHQIVRTALDLHLERLKREYGGCGCMAVEGGCTEGCSGT